MIEFEPCPFPDEVVVFLLAAEREAWRVYFQAAKNVQQLSLPSEREALQHFHSVKLGAFYVAKPRKVS